MGSSTAARRRAAIGPRARRGLSRAIGGVCAAGALLVVAGCAGGGDTAGGGTPSSAAHRHTLVVADGVLDTLLPANTAVSYAELNLLWAPIVAFHPNGSLDYVQARSITGSDHDRRWTITFRPGWTFQNGQPVTARSYADAWNLAAYGPNAYVNSGALSNIAGYGAVHPATGKPTAKTLSGLTVPDRYTLQVRLSKSDSQFPLELGQGQTAFYPMPTVGLQYPANFETDPIGDGPYEMSGAAVLNQQVNLTRYPGYRGPSPGHFARIDFRLYQNLDTGYTDAQAGNVDIDLAPQDKFAQLSSNFGSRIVNVQGTSVDWIAFPLSNKRYDNIKLREALSLAIDRQAINKAIFGGLYAPATSLIMPSVAGGSTHACRWCFYDPAKAKQLLKAAGGWSGTMKLTYPGGSGEDQVYQALANQLRENLGIHAVSQSTTSFSSFFAALDHRSVQGPFRGKWVAIFPSPSDTLHELFTPGGPYNVTTGGYTNPAVTRLISQGDAAPSPSVAIARYQEAERRIESAFPVIPTFYESFPFVYTSSITNVHALPHQLGIDLQAVRPR